MGALFGSSLSWILHLTTWYTSIAAQKITHKWFFWSEFSAKNRSVPNFSMKRKKRLIKAIVVEVTVAPDIYLNKNRLNRPFLYLQYEIKFVVNFNHESSNIVHGFHFFYENAIVCVAVENVCVCVVWFHSWGPTTNRTGETESLIRIYIYMWQKRHERQKHLQRKKEGEREREIQRETMKPVKERRKNQYQLLQIQYNKCNYMCVPSVPVYST